MNIYEIHASIYRPQTGHAQFGDEELESMGTAVFYKNKTANSEDKYG